MSTERTNGFVTADEHDAVVRRSFEHQTHLFTGEDSFFARRAPSELAWLEPLSPHMIVLDVACGAAHAAEQVAPHVRQAVGLDLTPALLALGAERLRGAGIANVLLQEGDAARLPFLDASFDLVFCRSALHHFPDPAEPVAEMARVCRPGGRVVVADVVAPDAQVRDRFDDLHRQIDPSHAGVLLESEVSELLRATVGPLGHPRPSTSVTLPVQAMLTDLTDRDPVMSALRGEMAGGPATGFSPRVDADGVLVSFTSVLVHATRRTD
jgi:ubiquinone/menaquinone biosynthesis C-methylase UbiE